MIKTISPSLEKARDISKKQDIELQKLADKHMNGDVERYKKMCMNRYWRSPFSFLILNKR